MSNITELVIAPKNGYYDEDEDENRAIEIGPCDYMGCKSIVNVEWGGGCTKCNRLFCSLHEEMVYIAQHDSDTDTDDDNTIENGMSGVGCTLCCMNPKYAHLRIFSDTQILAHMLGKTLKTRDDVCDQMRKVLIGKRKPHAAAVVKDEDEKQDSLFDSLRIQ